MKHYNFDEIVDRKNTFSVKYDRLKELFGSDNLLSLWVADMDFRTPDFIMKALKERCEHEIFGYTYAPDSYYESILAWVQYRYNWKISREWLSYIPGIVRGIAFALDCFTKPGDKVIIQPPVYHPFRLVPESLDREVVNNPLILVNGKYEMDFEHLESIIDPGCKAFILCNPHNPGGIVWTKDTLIRLAEICHRHGIIVISDEIHAEMVYPGNTQFPFAMVSPEAASNSICYMAPSKTFNIAGIVSSYAIVPDDTLRERFFSYLKARELGDGTIFAYTATEAAYTYGAEWLQQMRHYVIANGQYVDEFLKKNIPQIKVYPQQASFLLWLDCRELNLSQEELVDLFVNKAGLALNDGSVFGKEGIGYMRMNIGCPRSVLEEAMASLMIATEKK